MKTIELCEYESKLIDETIKPAISDFLSKSENERFFKLEMRNSQLCLKASKYVGTIQHKGLKINIYPKLFHNGKQDEELTDEQIKLNKALAIKNFMFMLNYGYNLPKLRQFNSSVDESRDSFFEVLIYLFAHNLLETLKVNPNRSYITVEDESNFLKGTWRLGEQLSKAPHLKHKFFVAYDDFTANNELNRILKFVSRKLIFATSNSANKNLLQNILLVYAEIDDIGKPENASLDKVKFSRMNQEYKPIFELARLFLNNLSSHTLSSKISTFTFMFDMNVLFEQFIAGFIRKERLIPCGLEMRTQARSMSILKDSEGNDIFCLKPDILFTKGEENTLIIDTKYKLLDHLDPKLGISQSDVYQMYAYSQMYNCPDIILLYPQHSEMEKLDKNFTFNQGGHRLHIRTVDVCRDLTTEEGKKGLITELKNIFINFRGEEDGK